jgi:hypothetical protein
MPRNFQAGISTALVAGCRNQPMHGSRVIRRNLAFSACFEGPHAPWQSGLNHRLDVEGMLIERLPDRRGIRDQDPFAKINNTDCLEIWPP